VGDGSLTGSDELGMVQMHDFLSLTIMRMMVKISAEAVTTPATIRNWMRARNAVIT
jgi:hypothetical protein